MFFLEKFGRQHRHEHPRENERAHHREAHGQREWNEERLSDSRHEKRRNEDRKNAEQSQQLGLQNFRRWHPTLRAPWFSQCEMGMNVFDRDGRLVDENADGESQASERHDVHGLMTDPKAEQCETERERDIQRDDQNASRIAQKKQDHQSGEQRPDRPFEKQGANCVFDVDRLVELVVDLDIFAGAPTRSAEYPFFTTSTTASVEASARLVTGM